MKKINLKQIEQIIELQNECDLEKLVNNLTKKKLRILVYQLLKTKEQLNLQIANGIEASIEQAQYCLEQKKIGWASNFLKQTKKEVNKLWEIINKGKK